MRAQLRPTCSHGSRREHRKPNSGERPVPRRKVPAPVRVVLAGAGGCKRASAPIRPRSSKKSVPLMSQLRPTFSRRRRNYYRKPNSGEKPVPRRKAQAPLRVVLAGAGERTILQPPTSPRSSEDSLRIRAQLRPTFARRRRDSYRKPNSGERGVPRTKAPAPVRVVFAGASERTTLPPPINLRSS